MKADPANPDRALMCRVPGCGVRWAVDVSHGKVCSFHDEQFRRAGGERDSAPRNTQGAGMRSVADLVPVPKHEPAPHWQDDEERPF